MSPTEVATSRRRWHQFSLRTLLIVVAVVAGLAFAYVKTVEPYRLQREAMAAIIQLGGMCETKTPDSWISYLDNKAQDVVVVDLRKCDNVADLLPLLARLPQVEAIDLRGTSISDEQMGLLTPLRKLRMLSVDNTGITDAGLATIGAFPDLRHISASATNVGDAGLALMAGLPRLRYLDVSDTWPVSDRHVNVSDEGVSYLSRSKTLRGSDKT